MLRRNFWLFGYLSETCNIAGSHGCSKYVNNFKRQKLKDGENPLLVLIVPRLFEEKRRDIVFGIPSFRPSVPLI